MRTSQAAIEATIAVLEREDSYRHTLIDLLKNYLETTREVPLEARITRRQGMVLELVAEGLENAEIAGRLQISRTTVRRHVSDLMRKLGSKRRSTLAVKVMRLAS